MAQRPRVRSVLSVVRRPWYIKRVALSARTVVQAVVDKIMMKTSIFLDEVRFHAFHGVMPQERAVGADFTVWLKVGYDFVKAAESDELIDTISYADLYEVVRAEMDKPSQLLEHVALRIVKAVAARWPRIDTIDLRLAKDNPPMGADCKGAGVEIHYINK